MIICAFFPKRYNNIHYLLATSGIFVIFFLMPEQKTPADTKAAAKLDKGKKALYNFLLVWTS